MTRQKYLESVATIELLQERFPKTFFVREIKRKPLAIGIDRAIIAQLNGTLSPEQLHDALRSYVGAQGYLAALRPNAVRVDLAGEAAGEVSAPAAKVASEQLASKLLKQDERRQARLAQERAAVKPEAVVEKGPKRLTLADLRMHALAKKVAVQ